MAEGNSNGKLSLSNNRLPALEASKELIQLTNKILLARKSEISVRIIPYRIGGRYRIFDYETKTLSSQDFENAYFLKDITSHSKSCVVEAKGMRAIISNFADLWSPNWHDKGSLDEVYTKADPNVFIEDTEWRIDKEKLFFQEKLIYEEDKYNIEELYSSGFYFGVSMIQVIVDVDPEFGVQASKLGYVDLDGNKYWED